MEIKIIPEKYSKLAAQLAFLLLLFFVIFGTSLPLQDGSSEISSESKSNPVNQFGFSLIIVLSAAALLNHRRKVMQLLFKEKFLFLFLFWCFASTFWSQESFISFKRWVQIIAPFFASIAILVHHRSSNDLLKYIEWILYPYLVASILASLFIPAALDPQFHTWRGLTYTKNNLGQVGLTGVVICSIAFKSHKIYQKQILALVMLAISFLLIIGSRSMTSTITTVAIIGIVIIMFIINRLFPFPNIAKFLIIFTFAGIAIGLLFVLVWDSEFFINLPQYAGKDATFTGRTDIWRWIVNEIQKHPFMGCGYSSFWVYDNAILELIERQLYWLPNQSHNGYLDIINETGFVGISFVFLMVVKYFMDLSKSKDDSIWKWLIVGTLIINVLESTLFRPKHLTGTFFIFAYLSFYYDRLKTPNNVKKSYRYEAYGVVISH